MTQRSVSRATEKLDRRDFLQRAALLGGVAASGYFVHPTKAGESKSPNERLNIAAVGSTGRAGADIQGVSSENIVAIADVDSKLLEKGAAPYPDAQIPRFSRDVGERSRRNRRGRGGDT